MPGAIDAALRKFHASLNVSNIERSIAFYRVLLGVEPAKVRADYAKFDIAEPPLVLSLIPGRPGTGGHLNHVGLRVRNADELVEIQRRLEAAGMPTRREEGVECCYARQTKFWISDPDGALWEIYVFHDDIDDHGTASPPVAQPVQVQAARTAAAPRAWEHHIREAVPATIPHGDNSLDEIRLTGSINVSPTAADLSSLFTEALRTLRPEATIHLHGLAGDRECAFPIALPGPAAAVQHVPTAKHVAEALAAAGFVDILIEKLSSTAYYVVDGVSMRELRMTARKPGHRPAAETHLAVYLGPMSGVVDDFGTLFRRGVPTPVNVHDWQVLAKGESSRSFLLLKSEDVKDAACCDDRRPAQDAIGTAGAADARS